MTFIELNKKHWNQVAQIYREGIETGIATFETEVPNWEVWDASHLKSCRIVAKNNNEVVGWAALTSVSSRCVYGGVAEVSVYVSSKYRGQKIGTNLLEKLIEQSEKEGFWTLQSGIFAENKASIKMHQNAGFRIIGYREKIGKLNKLWKDNVILERRSKIIGIH